MGSILIQYDDIKRSRRSIMSQWMYLALDGLRVSDSNNFSNSFAMQSDSVIFAGGLSENKSCLE